MTILLEAPLISAGTVVLEGHDGVVTSRVQIAKTGRFMDARYGKFAITRAEFTKWTSNFALSMIEGRLGLPVDIDHGPERRGDTRAAGWLTSLDSLGPDGKTPTPDELWATVEWNTLGQQLVGDKIYAYLSPSYTADAKDESGKSLGTALRGVGLTNRPFLTMAVVTLDDLTDFEPTGTEHVEPTVDSPPAMTDFLKRAREALQLSEDATEDMVLTAITAKQEPPVGTTDKTLAEQAAEAGQILLTAEQFSEMSLGAAAGIAAEKKLASIERDSAWDKALDAGTVTPGQKDTFVLMHDASPEIYFKTLDGLQPVVNVEERGGSGHKVDTAASTSAARAEAGDLGVSLDEDSAKVDAQIQTLMASEPTLTYGAAFDRVLATTGA